MAVLDLALCPICHARGSLARQTMQLESRIHVTYECRACGTLLAWLGDEMWLEADRWSFQKVGRAERADLLYRSMTVAELRKLAGEKAPTPPVLPREDPSQPKPPPVWIDIPQARQKPPAPVEVPAAVAARQSREPESEPVIAPPSPEPERRPEPTSALDPAPVVSEPQPALRPVETEMPPTAVEPEPMTAEAMSFPPEREPQPVEVAPAVVELKPEAEPAPEPEPLPDQVAPEEAEREAAPVDAAVAVELEPEPVSPPVEARQVIAEPQPAPLAAESTEDLPVAVEPEPRRVEEGPVVGEPGPIEEGPAPEPVLAVAPVEVTPAAAEPEPLPMEVAPMTTETTPPPAEVAPAAMGRAGRADESPVDRPRSEQRRDKQQRSEQRRDKQQRSKQQRSKQRPSQGQSGPPRRRSRGSPFLVISVGLVLLCLICSAAGMVIYSLVGNWPPAGGLPTNPPASEATPSETPVPTDTPAVIDTPAPTETAVASGEAVAPEAADDVEFQGVTDYQSSTGSHYLVGEVLNRAAETLRFVEVLATFYDGNGQMVGTGSTFTELSFVEPGSAAPFKLTAPNLPELGRYELQVAYSTTTQPPIRLELMGHSGTLDSSGWYRIAGEVRNPHGFAVKFPEIVATYYNATHEVVRVEVAFAQVDPLEPGQSSPFEVVLTEAPADLQHYTLLTEAAQQ